MSTTSYWGGSTLRNGIVRRLEASSFKEMVESYVRVPVPIPMTRKDFLAHPDRDELKDGPWISPCDYPYEQEGRRGNAHALHTVLLCFDLDEGEHVKDFFESPDTLSEHLFPYNFAVWASAKHTPKSPRLKLIIDISPCHPPLHKRLVAFFIQRLGLPPDFKGVTETSTISQGHYRPVKFKDEEFGAVLAVRTDGIAFDADELPDPEDELEELLEGRRYAYSGEGDEDLMGLASLPVPDLTVEDVKDALEHVDPDCDYKTWLSMCAGMRHQFTEEEAARQAYEVFDEWSSRGTKYKGEKETWHKWNSYRPYALGRDSTTVRTLFRHAISAGWNSSRLATKIQTRVDEWMAECDDADTLMEEGPARIAEMPFRNEVVEDSMITSLQTRIKELTGKRLAKVAIFKEVSKARKREKAEKTKERKDNPPMWLTPFCYVSTLNVFYDFGKGIKLTPIAFDHKYSIELMPNDGAETPANGKPVMNPSSYALNVVGIPRVDEALYCPVRQGEDSFFVMNGRRYLNLYNPLSVPSADPDGADLAKVLIKEFLHTLIGNEVHERIVLDFLSSLVQHPGRKILWAILIQSVEGVGKGFLGDIMRAVLGSVNVKETNPEVVGGIYNKSYTTGAVLSILNELHIPGERRERVTNALKAPITDDPVTVTEKYEVAVEVPNWVNFIAFTNELDAIHLKPGDRRWFAIKSPIQTKKHAQDLVASGYFDRMEPLKKDRAGALRYYLLHREIAADFPYMGPPPATTFRQAIIDESTNPLHEVIMDILDENDPLIGKDVISYNHLDAALPRHLKRNAAKIGHYLSLLGYEKGPRVRVCGQRTTTWLHTENYCKDLGSPGELLNQRAEVRGDLSEL